MTPHDEDQLVPATASGQTGVTVPRLALRPREAAAALGIGERLLWQKTNCGEIPCVRIGRAVVYPVGLLCDWLRRQASEGR